MKLGLGTTQFWYGSDPAQREVFYQAYEKYDITVIDTAEMYGSGRCEKEVSRILRKIGRDDLFIIDKILPENVTEERFMQSLQQSLDRLGTDCIDLYLLHWREDADLALLVDKMEEAKHLGYIKEWGVSNFDVQDLKDLFRVQGGERCYANEIFYNVFYRGIEVDLLPYMKEHGVLPISYSTLDNSYNRKKLFSNRELRDLCSEDGISVEALMLAFAVRDYGLLALFHTSSVEHLAEDLKCLEVDIGKYMEVINRHYPAPEHKVPLEKR